MAGMKCQLLCHFDIFVDIVIIFKIILAMSTMLIWGMIFLPLIINQLYL